MKEALRPLLTRLIDYAGLFPPAKLSMDEAVSNFARYRKGSHRWMLARFITPVSRLGELEATAAPHFDDVPWAISALPGADLVGDLDAIDEFNQRNSGRARVDTIETKADRVDAIREISLKVPDAIALFIEVPVDDDPAALLSEIARGDAFAKIRTGGVTPESFPPIDLILRFVRQCHDFRVRFKATAGLHHPLRCVRPLTYEVDAPKGPMNGFVNLFLAAALIREGIDDANLNRLLATTEPSAFSFGEGSITWDGHSVATEALASARREFAISFGSCSFEEPIDDLRELGWVD